MFSCFHRLRVLFVLALASLALCGQTPAQTLAHPNWVGNGMSTDPWWQHAVIYRVHGEVDRAGDLSTSSDLKYLATRINSIRAVGIDALLLAAPPVPGQSVSAEAQPAGPTEVDQLDDLIRLASSRGVRVLLSLSPARASDDLSGIARFWLSRGIAGFQLILPTGTSPDDALALVQSLRRLTAGAVGQRIVISDWDIATPQSLVLGQPTGSGIRRSLPGRSLRISDVAPLLELDSHLSHAAFNAASLRPALAEAAGQPNLLIEFDRVGASSAHGDRNSVSRLAAVLSLLTRPAAIFDADAKLVFDPAPEHIESADDAEQAPKAPAAPAPGVYLPYQPYVPPSKKRVEPAQPAPKDPLTAWYKQLAALHHGNVALRAGSPAFLDFDEQNALVWVARASTPSGGSAPVVVACNLSGSPVQLSLRPALERLGLRATYLRTLLRSDKGLGPEGVTAITLPPYGTYIGELRR